MIWNYGITAKNETRMFLLVSTMLSAIVLPSFSIHPSLPNIRLEELLLFTAFGLNVLLFAAKGLRLSEEQKQRLARERRQLKTIVVIFALFVLSYAISNIYGVYIRGAGYYGLRDVMELVTYLKYFLVLTLALSVDIGREEFDFLKKAFLAGVIFLIVLSWGQHLNALNLNSWLSPYFNRQHWDTLIFGNPARVLGTFDNPNYFGIFTVIVLSYLTASYFFGEHNGKFPVPLFILIGLVIKLEFLTISRTALFGIALLFAILSIWAFRYYKHDRKIIIKIGALFILTVILLITASADFFYRVQEGLDFGSSTSFAGHLDRWEKASGTIWQSPVFGWGTQKYVMTTVVDNEYALVARRYGFIGLAVYLSFFLAPFVMGLKNLSAKARKLGKAAAFDLPAQFIAAYAAVLPSVLVFNIMGGIFYHLQLMTLFAICMGLVYNSLRQKPDPENQPFLKQ
jgi:O-antigen ligase